MAETENVEKIEPIPRPQTAACVILTKEDADAILGALRIAQRILDQAPHADVPIRVEPDSK